MGMCQSCEQGKEKTYEIIIQNNERTTSVTPTRTITEQLPLNKVEPNLRPPSEINATVMSSQGLRIADSGPRTESSRSVICNTISSHGSSLQSCHLTIRTTNNRQDLSLSRRDNPMSMINQAPQSPKIHQTLQTWVNKSDIEQIGQQ